jgi:hypothetical protein
VTIDGVWIGECIFLTTYTHNTEPHVITAPPLIFSNHHSTCSAFYSCSLTTDLTVEILQLPTLRSPCHTAPTELLSTVNYIIASSLLSLLCRVQLKYQPSTELDCPNCFLCNSSARTTSKIPFLYCCVRVRFRGSVFTEPFPRNGSLFIRLLQSNGCTRCLSRDL